jgi:hypothetical protein
MLQTADPWYRFAAGACGALAPEIVRLYRIVSAGDAVPKFGLPYYFISLLFAALGGGLSVIWDDPNLLKCFWVGVSLPVIVSSFASRPPSAG